ncbi:hypothetical protein CMI37_11550 [Candidatus Pacearchaeota archaeon]|nr:hypothetical protein [Candidatus Pacearchaeota archaeon]|tara:strand:- start:9332 stop:9598 length:267 start_codon:yes stop_codon:yes gene_type:complete
MTKKTKTFDWREELADLAEKYCKHDDREHNSCLWHIFEPFIEKAIKTEIADVLDRAKINITKRSKVGGLIGVEVVESELLKIFKEYDN